MDIDDLGLLLAIKDSTSLSAVAKARGVAVSTVARRLDALESTLRLRLVDRRANGVGLTPDGLRIAALCPPAIEVGARIERAAVAMRSSSEVPPPVVSATEIIVSEVLAPRLPLLWARQPGLSITLRSESRLVSLAARDADLAIRMSRPEGASLIAKKLPPLKLGLYGSKTYLAGRKPSDIRLDHERLLVYDESYGRLPETEWIDAGGYRAAVAMSTGSTRALQMAAQAGAGIALLSHIAGRRLGLIEIPAPVVLPQRVPWLIVHRDLRRLPAVRSVHDWIIDAFARFHDEAEDSA
jgi:DNA-binding transcriptional LysR family regulator